MRKPVGSRLGLIQQLLYFVPEVPPVHLLELASQSSFDLFFRGVFLLLIGLGVGLGRNTTLLWVLVFGVGSVVESEVLG